MNAAIKKNCVKKLAHSKSWFDSCHTNENFDCRKHSIKSINSKTFKIILSISFINDRNIFLIQ